MNTPTSKTCIDCLETLPIEQFPIAPKNYKDTKQYRRRVCKSCHVIRQSPSWKIAYRALQAQRKAAKVEAALARAKAKEERVTLKELKALRAELRAKNREFINGLCAPNLEELKGRITEKERQCIYQKAWHQSPRAIAARNTEEFKTKKREYDRNYRKSLREKRDEPEDCPVYSRCPKCMGFAAYRCDRPKCPMTVRQPQTKESF
jgi:hypothetical protein